MNRVVPHTSGGVAPAWRPFALLRYGLSVACLALATHALATARVAAAPMKPRPSVTKPGRTVVDPSKHDLNRVHVKFRDDLPVRLRNGRLTNGPVAGWQ